MGRPNRRMRSSLRVSCVAFVTSGLPHPRQLGGVGVHHPWQPRSHPSRVSYHAFAWVHALCATESSCLDSAVPVLGDGIKRRVVELEQELVDAFPIEQPLGLAVFVQVHSGDQRE